MQVSELAPVRTNRFRPARRVHHALTAPAEKAILEYTARHAPRWLTSDQLTLLALVAQMGAGLCYALARVHRLALLAVIVCIALNWFGDSLDGTLARVRNQQRPRYGFYVDHVCDLFGAVALMAGLGASGLVHWPVAVAMLLCFLLLAAESFLATYTLGHFELSHAYFGPTELRLLLVVGNLALLHSAYATVLGHRMLLFDLGGTIAAGCMAVMVVRLALSHTSQLYREEPLP